MPFFSVRQNQLGYTIFLKGDIGPSLSDYEANVIASWLNDTFLKINTYSFFSFESFFDEKEIENYQIYDLGKKIGNPIIEKRDVVAIVNWLNSCIPELKQRIENCVYEPIIGEEPTKEEVKYYMETKRIGYYDAIEELRKKKYKKL